MMALTISEAKVARDPQECARRLGVWIQENE